MPQLSYRIKQTNAAGEPLRKGKRYLYETVKLDFCRKCYDAGEWTDCVPEEVDLKHVEHNGAMRYDGNHVCDGCGKVLKGKG